MKTYQLSSREREVADLLIEGHTNGVIATKLGISSHTVKFHVTSIIDKLGALTRTDAAVKHARWLDAQV